MEELMAAVKKYEASTDWINKQDKETREKHYPRYKKEVVDHTNDVYEKIRKELGYDPFENYEELLKAIDNI